MPKRKLKAEHLLPSDSAPACHFCGAALAPGNAVTEHLIPLSRGGKHNRQNVVLSCSACSQAKRGKTEVEFMHWRSLVEGLTAIEQSQGTPDAIPKSIDPIEFTVAECSQPEAVTRFVVLTWQAEAAGLDHVPSHLRAEREAEGMVIAQVGKATGRQWVVGCMAGPLADYYGQLKRSEKGR